VCEYFALTVVDNLLNKVLYRFAFLQSSASFLPKQVCSCRSGEQVKLLISLYFNLPFLLM